MISGYFKAVGSSLILSKIVSANPETTDDGSTEKNVAVPGFIKYQEFWPFDGRNPASVKKAWDAAEAFAASYQSKRHLPRLSVYGRPTFDGPWNGVPAVGEGLG